MKDGPASPLPPGTCFRIKGAHPHQLGNGEAAVWLTNLATEEEVEREVKYMLRSTDIYHKKDVNVGCHSHIEGLFDFFSTKAIRLETIDLSGCHLDTVAVARVASTLCHMPQLVALTMSSTGNGPFRGPINAVRPPASLPQVVYTLAVSDGGALDLSSKQLGPEDGLLLAAWMRCPRVQNKLIELDISDNAILGTRDEDTVYLPDGELDDRGQYRVLSHARVRSLPDPNQEGSEKLETLDPGLIINVTATKLITTTVINSPSKSKKDSVKKSRQVTRLYSPEHHGWISETTDDHFVAVKVRNNRGWDAICEALPKSCVQKFVAMDIGLGSAGSAAFIACLEEGSNLAEVRFDRNRLIPLEKQQAIRDTCTRLGESRSVPCALYFGIE